MKDRECDNCVSYNKQLDDDTPEKVSFSGSTIIIDKRHKQAYRAFKQKPYYMNSSK